MSSMRISAAPEHKAPLVSANASPTSKSGTFADALSQAQSTSTESPWPHVANGLVREIDRGEAVIREVTGRAGTTVGSADLLRLQIGIYRYTESVDLTAKCIDRATNAVKTIVQGQG